MFVPGVCAGVIITLFMLLFAAGSANGASELRSAEPQTISVVIFATATPELVARNFAPPARVPAAQSNEPPDAAPTSSVPVRLRVTDIPTKTWVAFSETDVLSTTLPEYLTDGTMCRIQENICPYSYLVGNLDAGIAFPVAGTTQNAQNRLMHPAMLKPLAALRAAVLNRWGGKNALVVMKAYDPAGDLSALGQTAEITLLPKPGEQEFAAFCGMAFRAGFDWVGNEGDRCRVAIKAVPLCAACPVEPPTIISTPTVFLILLTTPTATMTATVATPGMTPAPVSSSGNASSPVSNPSPIP